MTDSTVQTLKRPIDTRDRLPDRDAHVLARLRNGSAWHSVKGSTVHILHKFSAGPVYWMAQEGVK